MGYGLFIAFLDIIYFNSQQNMGKTNASDIAMGFAFLNLPRRTVCPAGGRYYFG